MLETGTWGMTRRPARKAVAILLALLAIGCATRGPDAERYVRDGVRYGVTKGRFRGRWWNHYERGRSFLEGAYYDEAERDFRQALADRGRDQLWPRTYGLHFIPEYFPHRELGVSLFYGDQLEEARAELEVSLSQRHSARAAFYVGEVRRRLLDTTGADAAAPALEVLSPKGAVPIGATEVTVAGVARDDTYVAEIDVDGRPCDVRVSAPEVAFEQVVPLRPGDNAIRITARDLAGKSVSVQLPIRSDVDGPSVSFDGPVTLPGTVQGVALDPAGVAALRIAGKAADLSEGPGGAVAFSISLRREELTPPLRYECEDSLGNRTYGALPFDALVLSDAMPDATFAGHSAQVMPLGGGLSALVLNGEMIAVAAVAEPVRGVQVALANLDEGRQYFMDEIVAVVSVTSENPVEQLTLNGEPVDIIPGRKAFRVSRRLRLTEGANALTAEATDAAGASGKDVKTIERALTEIEMDKAKLAIAFLGNLARTPTQQGADEAAYVLNELVGAPAVQGRFTVVSRDLIDEILAEQELSAALSTRRGKLALGRLVPADVMMAAWIRRDAESIEIVLNGASTDTGRRVASYVDVAGRIEDVDRLIEDLGLRLAQEIPRIKGNVVAWQDPRVTFDLHQGQGIRQYLKCIVYRTEDVLHPETGEVLGPKATILCEGLIGDVGGQTSTARVIVDQTGEAPVAAPIQAGDFVVIK